MYIDKAVYLDTNFAIFDAIASLVCHLKMTFENP